MTSFAYSPTPEWDPNEKRHTFDLGNNLKRLKEEFHIIRDQLDKVCREMFPLEERRTYHIKCLENKFEHESERAYADSIKGFRHLMTLATLVAAYIITFTLLHNPLEYLISQSFGMNDWKTTMAVFLLPIILVLFQVGIAIIRSEAHKQEGKRRSSGTWKCVSRVLISITPLAILALFFAQYPIFEKIPKLHSILLLFVRLGFGYATDVSILCNGDNILQSQGYIWFLGRKGWHEWCLKRLKRPHSQKGHEAETLFQQYWRTWLEYRSYAPDNPLHHLHFNTQSDHILRTILGYDPNYPPTPDNNGGDSDIIQFPDRPPVNNA